MTRVLRHEPDAAKPGRMSLDGGPVEGVRVQHVIQGGGIWIADVPQFDISLESSDGDVMFVIPPETEAPDWYERLARDHFAFVDWTNTEVVSSHPLLSSVALRRHEGRRALAWVEYYSQVSRILAGNATELRRLLAVAEDPRTALELMDVRNRDMLSEYQHQTDRVLHNFLASVMSRVDLLRHLVTASESAPAPPLRERYREKVRALFVSDGLAQFLQCLRNYVLHRSLPPSRHTMSLGHGNIDLDFFLDKEALLLWDGWNQPARQWLVSQDGDIRLRQVVQQYMARVAELDSWLVDEFTVSRSADIEDFFRAQEEHFARFGNGDEASSSAPSA